MLATTLKLGFNPWLRKVPCRREWQPTLVLLPGESHGQRNLVSYIVHGVTKESDMTESLTLSLSHMCIIQICIYVIHIYIYIFIYLYNENSWGKNLEISHLSKCSEKTTSKLSVNICPHEAQSCCLWKC